MTTWVFGDLDTEVTGDDVTSLALKGTALEFAYQRFNIARKKIQNEDTVIVGLTNFDRRWFFKAYPEYAVLDTSPTNDKKENKAITLYRKYLDHKEIHRVYLLDFLYNLHGLTEELNLKTVIIPQENDVKSFLEEKKTEFPLFDVKDSLY